MFFFRSIYLVALGLGLATAHEANHPHRYDDQTEKMSPQATFYKPSLAPYLGHGHELIEGHGLGHGLGGGGHGGMGQSVGPLYGGVSDHSGLNLGLGHGGGYDDLHKYGGIGKKAKIAQLYDHGSKGFKNIYGDSGYGNSGLNKYSGSQSSDHYGGKSGNHANYNNGHVYTRNRGYGYEKHYMYDKEYSTSNKHGAKGGKHEYFGDHDKSNKYGADMHKKYGHKKYGNKMGHADHSYGKFDHLLDKHTDGMGGMGGGGGGGSYIDTSEHMPMINDGGYHSEYVPAGHDSYSGALNHGTPIIEAHSAHGMGDSYHGFEPQSQYSSDSGVVYLPSKESSETSKMAVAPPSGVSPSVGAHSLADSKPIDGYSRVASAVHATPAVISTATGAHYYASS